MDSDDARMLALHIVCSAKAQEIPGYPITRLIEGGHIGIGGPRYDWRSDRLEIEGHVFSVRELVGTLGRLREMAASPQLALFEAAA